MGKIIRFLCVLLSVVIIFATCFVGYLQFSYYRIGDENIDIFNNQEKMLEMKVKARLLAKKHSTQDICKIVLG